MILNKTCGVEVNQSVLPVSVDQAIRGHSGSTVQDLLSVCLSLCPVTTVKLLKFTVKLKSNKGSFLASKLVSLSTTILNLLMEVNTYF